MSIVDKILHKSQHMPNWVNRVLIRANILKSYTYGFKYIRVKKHLEEYDYPGALRDSLDYALKHVAYYRNRYDTDRVKRITDLATIDKDTVLENFDDFIADKVDLDKCHVGSTGGTSGKAMKIVNPSNRYNVELAHAHTIWQRFGWDYDIRAVIRNHKLPEDRIYTINPFTREYIFDAFRISPEYVAQIHAVLVKNKIRFIHSYPSSAYQFCKLCVNQGLRLDFIEAFFCASEAITPEQRYFICDQLGIKLLNWYGHSEKLVFGGYCPHSDYIHIEPTYGYFELLDKNDRPVTEIGEMGEITGTTLHNRKMPLLRYRTGDYAEYAGDYCPHCNRHVTLLKNVQGRWDRSLIYKKDGTTTSITILNLHNELYEYIDGLQYIQERAGELIVLIIKNDRYDATVERRFIEHFQDGMGADAVIELRYVQNLIFQPNGKFLPLISNLF